MKITIEREHTFTVKSGAAVIRGLFQTGEWEGMAKYQDASGNVLILNDDIIVKASPDFAYLLQSGAAPGFVPVPETTLPGGLVVPAFQVMQFAASKSDDGKAVVDPSRKPWTNIDFDGAVATATDAGYCAITETQWLAIAWNASQQAENWTGGEVGKGDLYQGIRNGDGPKSGDHLPDQRDPKVRRWLTLSNGTRIYDINGNVWQWVFDDVQGDARGIVKDRIAADSISLSTAPYPSLKNGMGWRPDGEVKWSGGALIRGGCWVSGGNAGAFSLDSGSPGCRRDGIGFRCTKPSSGL